MDNNEIFAMALNVKDPWQLEDVDLRQGERGSMELHIDIGLKKGAPFHLYSDPSDEGSVVRDADGRPAEFTADHYEVRTFRHLNFFNYRTYLHVTVPVVKDAPEKGLSVLMPWMRPGLGFTLI